MKTTSISTPRILLVDDCKDGLLVRKTLLEELGIIVQIANNGEEGLKLFESTRFDVVVTDYRMPRMDGVELIERIRAIDPHSRIILLSKVAEPLGLTEETTGADAVIAKTSSEPANLQRWVKRLLNRGVQRKPPVSQKRRVLSARIGSR
ncbi:MAG TPA: response regulator [Verrucomicrobiae bacterium]|nr:response regulator [Verrucomicrobiae bacterium]